MVLCKIRINFIGEYFASDRYAKPQEARRKGRASADDICFEGKKSGFLLSGGKRRRARSARLTERGKKNTD